MILHALTLHGLHAFPDVAVTVDFDQLPPLVAIEGANGAGKTTLLDAIMACLIGEMPYRPGALHRNFVTSGELRLRWSLDDRDYESVLRVDPDVERTEGTLSWGAEVLAGPLIRDYRRKVRDIVGSPDLLLTSMYAVQTGAGAFLRASRADRKTLLTELLALHRYPALADACRDRARGLEAQLGALRARIADLDARAGGLGALDDERETTVAALGAAEQRIVGTQAAVDAAQGLLTSLREERARLTGLRQQSDALATEIRELETRIVDTNARITRNRTLLDRASEIRDATIRDSALRADLEALARQIEEAGREHQEAVQRAKDAAHVHQTAHLRWNQAATDRTRLEHQGGLLSDVPCHGAGEYAGCPLLKDARSALDALPAARAEEQARQAAIPSAAIPTAKDLTIGLRGRRDELLAKQRGLGETLKLVGPLEAAEARLEELAAQRTRGIEDLDVKTSHHATLVRDLERLPAVEEEERLIQGQANDIHRTLDEARRDVGRFTRDLGRIEERVATAREAATALEAARAEEGPRTEDLADWTLLTRAFGPSGIPALLIDQALPEIGTLATDLLRECFGEQVFTIALTTQRESAAGDKLLETLDVVVSRGGEPLDAALLSGGESVLVSEALSLAIALFQAGRSGRRIQTLIRDEVSAPLDVDRAPAYVRMLRRAARLGDFRHVLFVSHQLACLELADARLVVGGGKVVVQ